MLMQTTLTITAVACVVAATGAQKPLFEAILKVLSTKSTFSHDLPLLLILLAVVSTFLSIVDL